jgi:putative hydrolase of the HAD superfamily
MFEITVVFSLRETNFNPEQAGQEDPPACSPGCGDTEVIASRKYRAIIFDVGSTLLDITGNPHQFSVEAVAHLGLVEAVALDRTVRQIAQEWRDSGGRPEVADLSETWLEHYRRALAALGFSGDIDRAAGIIESRFLSEGWAVYPDVQEVLANLRDCGYRLGIVSNWPPTLDATLERAGLRHFFEVVVSSGNVGFAKPHPQIFRIAVDQMRMSTHEALYIGDSLEHDVNGARAAGMDVVLLDRSGGLEFHGPRIKSLSELPAWISSSSTKEPSADSQKVSAG